MAQKSWSLSRTASSGFSFLIGRTTSHRLLLIFDHLLQHIPHRSSYFSFLLHPCTGIREHRRGTIAGDWKDMLKVNRELSRHVGMMGSSFTVVIFYVNALAEFISSRHISTVSNIYILSRVVNL